jgi:exonuclease VII large subunit
MNKQDISNWINFAIFLLLRGPCQWVREKGTTSQAAEKLMRSLKKRQGTTSQAAEKLMRSLKKRQGTTSQAAEKLMRSLKKRQGTTSVVPQAEQN